MLQPCQAESSQTTSVKKQPDDVANKNQGCHTSPLEKKLAGSPSKGERRHDAANENQDHRTSTLEKKLERLGAKGARSAGFFSDSLL